MGGDHRGGKRHRHGDGGHHRGGRGGGFRPPPLSAADRELREMRDAIIHCDGSPEMTTNLAGLLANDLPSLNEPATRFLLECVEELPVKTPVYAALLGLLNKTSPEFAEEAVGAVVTRLEERLGSTSRDDQSRAKLLTRFLTMLPQVGVVKHTDAIDVLDALVCAAGDAADVAIAKSRQGDSDKRAGHLWQPRSDFLVGCALAATPWCGASFASATEPGAADAFDRLLTSVEEYLAKRNRRGPDPSAMTFGAGGASEDAGASLADDWLEETFGRVNETRRAGRANPEAWTTASVPALLSAFPEFSTEALSTRDETRVPPPTKVPFLSFTSVSEALAAYPVRPRLRILSQKMTEGLWEAGDWGPLERFVAEEYIADTLWAFEPGFKRGAIIPAAEQLGTLPLPGDHPERCQFLVAETLFGEMLALPAPRHAAVFYHVVIQDLCAAIPTFPKMMAKVVGQMFAQIARMDVEARERLADWMAHHLSCFDLAWPWKSWAHVAAQDKRHPQRRFCESVVKRLCRSCFQKRVSDSLPDELRDALMPAYACSSNGKGLTGLNARYLESLGDRTKFRASQGTGEETNALAELGDLLRRKTPSDEIVKWFESSGAREQLGDVLCAETLTAAALRHGQKCLTHHDVLLKRYSGALAEFSSKEEKGGEGASAEVGAAIVAAASGVWSGTHPRMAVAAVSRLVALEVVAPSAVAKWLETYAFEFESGPGVSDDDDEETEDYLSGTRWGTDDAFEIAAEAFGARVAAARQTESVANDAETRRREAERAASAAEAAREDAEQRDALTQRDQFARTAQAHRDRALAFERERSAAAGPAAAAKRAAAEAAAAAGASLARGVVKMKDAEAAAALLRGASATGKDAGRDAAPETRAYRAMALAAAALRRMRDVGGAALESATAAAATAAGAGEATLAIMGESLCGPGGFDAAATASVAAGDDVVAMAE